MAQGSPLAVWPKRAMRMYPSSPHELRRVFGSVFSVQNGGGCVDGGGNDGGGGGGGNLGSLV